MKNVKMLLVGLFGLQILLVAILYAGDSTEQSLFRPLLGENADDLSMDVEKIVIEDAQTAQQLELRQKSGQWQLPDGLPLNQSKLDSVLSSLFALRTNWPVATTTSSHDRFEVDEEKYQKRIQLYSGGEVQAELFIGTSPGFKKSHVRVAGKDEVYALPLNNFEYSVSSDDWLDNSLLHLGSLSKIQGSGYDLSFIANQWGLASRPEGKVLLQDKVKELATAIQTLNVQGVQSQKLATFPVGIKVNSDKGELSYQLFKDASNYALQRSDHDIQFKISQYDYDKLAGVLLDGLLEDISEPEERAGVEPKDKEGELKE